MERPNEGGASSHFWCNICKVTCVSAINLQTHFLGSKHKLLEKALKAHGIVKSGSPDQTGSGKGSEEAAQAPNSPQVVGLGEQLDGCRSTEPAIGLEYLFEYRTHGNYLWYECQLCKCEAGLTNMFMHVVGAKHRQAYLQKHYPEMGEIEGRGSEVNRKLKQLAAEIEAKDGRKKIQVVTDTQQLKRKSWMEEVAPAPKKNKAIDFTSDDCFLDPPPPPPPPSHPQSATPKSLPPSPNFQELKKAYTETVKRQGLDKSVDGFGTKKELLEYLRQFQILCEDDASFILKVTQNFTQSLVKYREKVKEKAEAAAAAVTFTPEQEVAPQSAGQNIYTEYPPKNIPGQREPGSGQPSSACNAGPPTYAAPPKAVVPTSANVTGLPGGLGPETNKATIEFFTSIKNMDAEEVSATLNKIAATNPAFKGIDIPNVIKILQESGSLKPSKKVYSQF